MALRTDTNPLHGPQHGSKSSLSTRSRLAIEDNERLQAENRRLNDILENGRAKKASTILSLTKEYQDAQQAETRKAEIQLMVRKAQELDICFLLDATGSMKPAIDMVKEKMRDMSASIKSAHPNCRLRVSLVVYRDYDMPITKKNMGCNFTADFIGPESTFHRSVASVQAVGGGDAPEDVFSGLEWVAKLDWQATNRLLFHICDAPCHGTNFHDYRAEYDNYPQGDKFDRSIDDILRQLVEKCDVAQYTFCHLNDDTKKMVRKFRKAVGKQNWIVEEQFQGVVKIPRTVIEVSLSTIQKSLSAGFGGDKGFVPTHVEETKPEWTSIVVLNGRNYQHMWYTVDELFLKIRKKTLFNVQKDSALQVQIAKYPFSADGCVRWPYNAQILQINKPPRSVVLKRFKDPLGHSPESAVHSWERYFSQMEVQVVAVHMAKKFNQRVERKGLSGVEKVIFPEVSVLKVRSTFYNMEDYLEGNWVKYSNNGGYVNTEINALTLQAFSHWTHAHSGGILMVTDLQGMLVRNGIDDGGKSSNTFWLSDPAIHCTDVLRFTRTNLGEDGFKLFFGSHICNDICRHLGLKPVFTESDFGSMIDRMKACELKDDCGSGQPTLSMATKKRAEKEKKVSVAPSLGAIVEGE